MTLHTDSLAAIEEIRRISGPDRNVVFVSGIFHIIHPGHSRLLRYAAQQGGCVVVGVTADSQASEVIIGEQDRLQAIQDIGCVHYAFILRDRAEEFIAALKPRTVIKGLEHKHQHNPEQSVVQAYGGRLIFSSGETLFSSLELIKKEMAESSHPSIQQQSAYLERHGISRADLLAALESMKAIRVVVIGDTIVDEYLTCDPVGLSREDPTVVVRPISSHRFLGGAGIVAAHARALGGPVEFFTVVGADKQAEFAFEKLEAYGVRVNAVTDDTRPTSHKLRYRAHQKTMLRVNSFSEQDIDEAIQEKLLISLTKALDNADLLIFSDFNYGVLPQKLVNEITRLARARGLFIAADSQSSSQIGDISRFGNVSLATPTEHEARLAVRDTNSGLASLALYLSKTMTCDELIVTLGAEGIFIHAGRPHGDKWMDDRLPAFNTAPKDPAGAGDALLVAASLARTAGHPIWLAAYLGSLAAACQVDRIGNTPLALEELRQVISRAHAL